MSEIDQWIEEASVSLGREFSPVAPPRATEVIAKAKALFVRGSPRVWWLGLLHLSRTLSSANQKIASIVPNAKAWLLPEHGAAGGAIYELTPDEIDAIRENCPPFEYNVVDKEYRWMVSGSDHDQFLVSVAQAMPQP